MGSLTSSLLVKLIDQVTAPAKQMSASIKGIGSAFAGLSGKGMMSNLDAAIKANAKAVSEMRGRLVDAVAGFYLLKGAIGEPIRAARELDSQLTQLGLKVGATFNRNEVREGLRKLSRETTQSMSSLTSGIDMLVSKGAELGTAFDLAPTIGKATSAYKGSMADLASAGYAAVDNLKIPASEAEQLFDILAQSGKDGAFEINNMAKEFPTLAAQYQSLEQTGLKAAANLATSLQVAMKGAGSPEEAATNVKNLLQQIYAPRTVKNFAKMGVNLRREMTQALKKGMSPEMAIADITNRTLKGDLSKMGQLFMNAQAQQALRPLIQNRELWQELNKKAYAARDKKGIDQDYKDWLQTPEGAITRLTIALGGLKENIGSSLLTPLRDIAMSLAPIVEGISDFAAANPKLISTLVGATAALIGFKVAAIAVRYASLQAKGGVLELASGLLRIGMFGGKIGKGLAAPFVGFGRALGRTRRDMKIVNAMATTGLFSPRQVIGGNIAAIGRNMLGLLNPVRLAGAAFRAVGMALRFAFIGTGIGAIIAGIAAAGTWIYNNWSGLSSMFSSFASTLQSRFPGAAAAVGWVVDKVKALWNWVSDLLGPMNATEGAWKGWGASAANAVADVVDWIASVPGRIAASASEWATAFGNLARAGWDGLRNFDWAGLGREIVQAIIDGIASMASAFVGKLSQMASDAAGKVKGFFSFGGGGGASQGVNVPSQGQTVGGFAKGGNFSGGPMIVGEQGPELITASSSGHVHTAAETRRMLGGGRAGGGGTSSLTWSGNVVINGNASKEDADAIAERIMQKLSDLAWTGQQSLAADIG